MSTSIGKTVWTQSVDEEDPALEISIPVVLPAGVRTKELTVLMKESDVLCIRHKDTTIVQWRLYSRVLPDVEWRAEQDRVIVDLQKRDASTWPSLLNLPMRADDRILATRSEIDAMLKREVKPLPKPVSEKAAAAGGSEINEEDLERLLEETAEEVENLDVYVKAELKGMEEEESEMNAKMKQLEETVETTESDEERTRCLRQIELLQKMLSIHAKTRELRSQECNLDQFLQCQYLDLQKSRVNIGESSETETELFHNDEERAMTAHQLLTLGVKCLQEEQVETAIHLLRLAAVHHKHPQSISILFRVYTELGSPRGAFLLLQRAKDDEDLDVTSNLQVAEMFDRGARHFPPIFGAAVNFYQRAARCGSVHAMIGLAQLYLRGSTSATTLNEAERAANVNLAKYHAWLEQAIDRGSGAALFIKGCMHLRGEHGLEKSYAKAKEFLDRAGKCQPEIMKRAVGVNQALEKLRVEEEALLGTPSSPASPPASPASPSGGTAGSRAAAVSAKPGTPKLADAAARLAALDAQAGGGGASVDGGAKKAVGSKKTSAVHAASSARSRAFWERAATTGTAVYCLWTLAFPLRVLLLPQFYTLVQWFIDRFGFSLSSQPNRGMMM